jgi:hypothetical protein
VRGGVTQMPATAVIERWRRSTSPKISPDAEICAGPRVLRFIQIKTSRSGS